MCLVHNFCVTVLNDTIRGPTSSSTGEDEFVSCWRDFNDDLKECLGSVVFPIGNMSVGLCRHRAVLFKVSTWV